MADYINKNILCQAYIHVELPSTESLDQRLEAFKQALNEFTQERAEFFLYEGVEVDVVLEEGSLKGRITILGAIGLVLHGVGQYPDIREGAIAIYDDAKRLAEHIVSEGLFESRAKHENVIRTEARTGVIGSLRAVIAQLDMIKKGNGTQTQEWMVAQLEKVSEDIGKLVENLNSDADKALVREGLLVQVQELPSEPGVPPRRRTSPDMVADYKRRRRDLVSALG